MAGTVPSVCSKLMSLNKKAVAAFSCVWMHSGGEGKMTDFDARRLSFSVARLCWVFLCLSLGAAYKLAMGFAISFCHQCCGLFEVAGVTVAGVKSTLKQ